MQQLFWNWLRSSGPRAKVHMPGRKNTQRLIGWVYQQAITLQGPLWDRIYRLLRRAERNNVQQRIKYPISLDIDREPSVSRGSKDESRIHESLLLCKVSSPWNSRMSDHGAPRASFSRTLQESWKIKVRILQGREKSSPPTEATFILVWELLLSSVSFQH